MVVASQRGCPRRPLRSRLASAPLDGIFIHTAGVEPPGHRGDAHRSDRGVARRYASILRPRGEAYGQHRGNEVTELIQKGGGFNIRSFARRARLVTLVQVGAYRWFGLRRTADKIDVIPSRRRSHPFRPSLVPKEVGSGSRPVRRRRFPPQRRGSTCSKRLVRCPTASTWTSSAHLRRVAVPPGVSATRPPRLKAQSEDIVSSTDRRIISRCHLEATACASRWRKHSPAACRSVAKRLGPFRRWFQTPSTGTWYARAALGAIAAADRGPREILLA